MANEAMTPEGKVDEEPSEGRPTAEGNPQEVDGDRTQCRDEDPCIGLKRIREAARRDKKVRFSALLHHITVGMLTASYRKLNPKAAPGIDDETWSSYGEGLEDKLKDLHGRIHRGAYRAKPARRAYIPKPDGTMRPLGIAALEDKIVQQAVVWILEQIYEEDFLGFSYGFRRGRSQHMALDALYVAVKKHKVNWIIDADIRKFFDNVRHEWLMKFLEHRIADRRMLRLVAKWLKAGVSEEGKWSDTAVGTPQGAVISPLLANIYLHYVLDLWVQKWRRERPGGKCIIVRYADDVVFGLQYENEAILLIAELKERLGKFGLEINEEKSKLIEFGNYAIERRLAGGKGKPETFDFLGFTHICGISRKNGKSLIIRRTSKKRMQARLKVIRQQLLWNRHKPIAEQGAWLKQVLRGYFQYHAIPGNGKLLNAMRGCVARAWLRALRRRGQKSKNLNWEYMKPLIKQWLPPVTSLHPYPDARFGVTT
ncbi:MAG: group II intron reverse transcriptase/maturase [bacterium]